MITAYRHDARSGVAHLRARQDLFSEAAKARLERVGSPARWMPGESAWDWPLTAAAVIALDEAAKELGETVHWENKLQEFAQAHIRQEAVEHQTRVAIERLIQDPTLPLDPYACITVNPYTGESVPPTHYQKVAYHWALRVGGLYLAWDPGCISGDAIIKVNGFGAVRPYTLRDLYVRFNGLPTHANGDKVQNPWKKKGIRTTKSLLPNGTLRHNEIKKVVSRGVKAVVTIRLKSGKSLTCTPDHEIAIPGGWARADSLTVGSTVLTNGIPVCYKCGSKRFVITYKYATYRGLCKTCMYPLCHKFGDKYKGGRVYDEDGYILRSGQGNHPYCDHHGNVREHRLVMEKHLGRYLLPHEIVHHKNDVKDDNRLSNLELTSQGAHAFGHGTERTFGNMDGGIAGTGGEIIFFPREDSVVSVESAGETDVYDIIMADPGRNFVADGVIVHNCGKTRGAADAAGGWYRTGLIPMMQPTFINGKPGVTGGVLILSPKTMLKTWQRELMLWQNMTGVIISGEAARKKRMAGTPGHAHIVNYESLSYVEDNQYSAIILDEIHRCANNTLQMQRALALSQRATRRLGLSGTPVTNSPESVFFQLLIIDQGKSLGPSKTRFLEQYFHTEVGQGGFTKNYPKENAIPAISAAMAKSTYFIKKEEVLDLPEKTHTPIFLEMTPEQEKYYKQLESEAEMYIQDATVTVEQASARMMKLSQLCQGFVLVDDGTSRHFSDAKTQALMELLTGELAGRKVIVWTYFQAESKHIAELLRDAGIKFVRIDGTITSQRVRDDAVDRFNNDPEIKVFLRQLSMSEGVTLLAKDCEIKCFDTVYMGLSYRMIDWRQSQDRNHRIGQRFSCSYRYLLTDTGIDKKIFNSVKDKSRIADEVHDEGKGHYAALLGMEVK